MIPKTKIKYSYGSYNCIKGNKQWIRLTEGCVWDCPWCYEPTEIKIFDIPNIEKNDVGIIDMNLLCKPEALSILKSLPIDNSGKKIIYEFICGFDYRYLTHDIALEMRKHHFVKLKIAWDWHLEDQFKILDTLKVLYKVGYKSKDVIVFMICNHPIVSYDECMKKLDLCKVWNVQVCDCYFDNQIKILKKFVPVAWSTNEAYDFRRRCRIHNQIVKRGIYPNIKNIQFKNKVI